MKTPLLFILLLIYSNLSAQITITNLTDKNYTNLYIIDSDSTLKTDTDCDYILNKSLLKKRLDSKKSILISLKLSPDRFYNIICFDTTSYPHSYNSTTFKYHISGKTKQVLLENKNVETEFDLHCTEGAMNPKFENFDLTINNKTTGNLIKIFIKYEENGTFERYTDFNQWNPITKGASRKMTLYNLKPKNATTIYLKYYIEEAGVIKENTIMQQIPPNQKNILFTIQ